MAFRIHLAQSAVRFRAEADESILSAGLRQGLALPFGCRSGGCASCRVRLLSGEVHYQEPPPALSDAEIEAGYILMCMAQPRSDLELQLHQPARLEELRPRILPARVLRRQQLSPDVVGLWLRLPRGEPFRYLPGQYVDFLLEDGRRRSFSIANRPQDDSPLEFHLRVTAGGLFAHYVQDDMPEKAILRFEGPLGAFYFREESERPAIFMAGGTGFAPIKAMLEEAFVKGGTQPLHLFWGARSREDLYLDALPRQWLAANPRFRYTPVLSEPDGDWIGERGFVHEAVLRHYPDLHGREVYLAGPPVMVHAGKQAFVQAGLDADHLYYDSFDYAFETWPGMG